MNVCHFDVFTNEPLHDIEIVNHQVEHYIDVQRTRRKLSYTVDLKIDRLANVRPQSDHRRIEALEVSYLEHGVAFFRGAYHAIGFFECSRYGFLNQNVNARLEQLAGNFAMRFSGNSNAGRVYACNQFPPAR